MVIKGASTPALRAGDNPSIRKSASLPVVGLTKRGSAFFEPDGPSIVWRPTTVQVRGDGLALSHGPYRTKRTDASGETLESWGHFTSTWKYDEDSDRWLIIFDLGGDQGMTPSDEERALLAAEPDCPGAP